MSQSENVCVNVQNVKQNIEKAANIAERELSSIELIAVGKTFGADRIEPLLHAGHRCFGENRVQEAQSKWPAIRKKFRGVELHLIGGLQTNKVKSALKLFDYIHSLDSEKLANKISRIQKELNINRKLFIQVNIGNEDQKSGVNPNKLKSFYKYCLDKDLDVIGTMCLPPISEDPEKYFMRMNYLNKDLGLNELSMGMSADYIPAIDNNATFIRVGSKIFGERKKKF